MKGKYRSKLKALANSLDKSLNIGKKGLSKNTIDQINDQLEKRELVKINVLTNNLDDQEEMLEYILKETNAEFVSHMGSKFVIYRQNEDPQKRVINIDE